MTVSRRIAIAAVLVAAGCGSAVEIPRLEGLTLSRVTEVRRNLHHTLLLLDARFGEVSIPRGAGDRVVWQYPRATPAAKAGCTVFVVFGAPRSLVGPPPEKAVRNPNLVGLAVPGAVTELAQLHERDRWVAGYVLRDAANGGRIRPSDGFDGAYRVVAQHPDPDAHPEIERGDPINLVVSREAAAGSGPGAATWLGLFALLAPVGAGILLAGRNWRWRAS